jgi:hypothetical protein
MVSMPLKLWLVCRHAAPRGEEGDAQMLSTSGVC